jgi:hypothetical protein
MTSYQDSGPRPEIGRYYVGQKRKTSKQLLLHPLRIIGNCLQGLETGSRDVVSYSISQNGIIFVLQSPLKYLRLTQSRRESFDEHMTLHGDAFKTLNSLSTMPVGSTTRRLLVGADRCVRQGRKQTSREQ